MNNKETLDGLIGLEKKGLLKLSWQTDGSVIGTLTEEGKEVGKYMEENPDWDKKPVNKEKSDGTTFKRVLSRIGRFIKPA